MHRFGMNESHFEAEHTAARLLVDQLGACLGEMGERRADVGDLVRDVVHAGSAAGEEAADRRVVAERAQELEPALADADAGRLDALLLDARAMLEPGAEEALIGVECAVEILDGETDVMHRAGCDHEEIVFDRLGTTMRASALALVLTAALLAGCGGHEKAAPANDEASKPAAQVFADAKAAATSASSAHVSGNIDSGGTSIALDLDMARGKGAKGSVTLDGRQADLVRIGDVAYVRGSDEFWQHYAGPLVAQLLHDKWVKAPVDTKRFQSLAPLTSLGLLFARISAHHGKLVNDGKTTYKGRPVVAIRDTSDNSKLYVSATGKPYPVAIVGGKGSQTGTIEFSDWNEHVSLTAPSGAIPIGSLGG